MNQLETAARRRQEILDFLQTNPGANMAEIGALLFTEGASRSRHHNTIRTMMDWREIRSEGVPRCRRYWAISRVTRPADTVKAIREANIQLANGGRRETVALFTGNILGRYIHTPGSNKNGHPGRGGQGAVNEQYY